MKNKKFELRTPIDIKIFLLFLLEYIRYPIDRTTLIEIISENTDELTLDYDECLSELADSGHLWLDETDGEKYFMISDSGRKVANELFDSIDKEFREKSIKSAIKHMSLSRNEIKLASSVNATENGRFRVNMVLTDSSGELLDLSITVSSRAEAEKIKTNFESHPESVYRGVLFSASDRIEYISKHL